MKKTVGKKILLLLILFINTVILADKGNLKVISPNGGEKLQINTYQGITWSSNNIERIDISYSTDDGTSWNLIFESISTEIRVVSWKIPDLVNEEIIIKIENSNGIESDISDKYFTVDRKISMKGSLNKISANNVLTTILPLGNSITYGITVLDTEVGDIKGYRFPLYSSLINAGISFTFTGNEHAGGNFLPAGYDDNAGFPGISDDQLVDLMKTGRRYQPFHEIDEQITPGPYLETYPADVILLHIGTNGNSSAGGTDSGDVEELLDEIKRYEDSTGTEIIVVLARIIDRVPNETYVNTFNNNIETMALDRVNNPGNDAYPDKIIIVDMQDSAGLIYSIDSTGTVGNGITGDMSDDLHPNEKGYYKMADLWFEALTTILVTEPVVTLQPQDFFTVAGKPVEFNVSATGTKPFTYQWKRNGSEIVGATDSIYHIGSVTVEDDSIFLSCTISNSAGNITTDEATLYVAGENERVKNSLQVLYDFESGGNKVLDNSGKGIALDLTIDNINNVKWVPFGLEVTSSTIISASVSPLKIYESASLSNEICLEAWIKPLNDTQTGPARIITFSKDGSDRNFTLGQDNNKFNARLRTTGTDSNGEPYLGSTDGSLTTELLHVVYTRSSDGVSKIFVNGIENSSGNVSGNFSTWDNSFSFGLANEFTTDRNWLGTFYLTAVYSRALSSDEIEHNFSVGFNGDSNLLFAPSEFAGLAADTLVNLTWIDNETSEFGYIIERKANAIDSIYYVLDTVYTDIVSYTDYSPKNVTSYFYRIKAYNDKYTSDYSDSIQVDNIVSGIETNDILMDFRLYQNYPNPFNPSTTISYLISKTSDVSLILYDVLGKSIITLINNPKVEKGVHNFNFSTSNLGSNLTSGVYFYRIVANPIDGSNSFIETKKLLLMK